MWHDVSNHDSVFAMILQITERTLPCVRRQPHSVRVVTSPDTLRHDGRHGVGDPCRRDVFRLPALSASVADARGRVRARLAEWGLDAELRDDAGLVVTELFTNAVRHTRSEKITCTVQDTGSVIRLEVTDQGRGTSVPLPCDAQEDEEGGRGLLLVSLLSVAWGSDPAESGPGRMVWAELAAHRAHRDPPRPLGGDPPSGLPPVHG
ncbi:Anti-sigma regulatory factor (Ser/Thr protein kinase) [Actinacidiphila rubida]|uniref:Anti-sigma regulatory factor (Ser/Thr protein kinase) n=1 Tax=Actinacidiphila rubida TaxID=310780 RepID=A0A1H8T266_9ACTN|nr:Anti-sigma regulatory factor (Ser/Thr protein kinase) [Actinacidiphila rubida]